MTTTGAKNGYGSLYGIGVGPGDPELLTIQAQKTLQQVPVICFTQLDDGKESYALSVVQGILDQAKPEFITITIPADDDTPGSPQTWDDSAKEIAGHLSQGRDVAFITEGDPMLYSTFAYVLEGITSAHPSIAVEIVPGVSSVMAAAASAAIPLVTHGQRLAILPAVYGIDDLREAIANYDTIVLMKVNRTLLQALANLETLGLAGKGIYVRRASTTRERVVTDLSQLTEEDLDYFSLLIIRK